MQGLIKPEGSKFEKFFGIVQAQAKKNGAVFFLYSEEGHDTETEEMELSDLSGWLIPEAETPNFESEWMQREAESNLDRWDDYFCFALWDGDPSSPSIAFKRF